MGAWVQHGGGKDDMIVYNSDHTLHAFLEYGGSMNTTLSTEEGRANVKNTILEALGALP